MRVRYVLAMGVLSRMRGLLGRRERWNEGDVLALAPCKSIHTFFMSYEIDVAFVDRSGRVIKSARDLEPGRLLACKDAYLALERPSAPESPWFVPSDEVGLLPYR